MDINFPYASKYLKALVFILILALYATFLVHKINLPVADDLPRQIKIGEEITHGNFDILYKNIFSYTEPDQNFYDHHWLSGVIFYIVKAIAGWSGLVVFKVIVLLSAFAFIFFTAAKKGNFWLAALFSVPAILILKERTGLRPEVFSYLFIAVYLYILFDFEQNPNTKKIWILVPLQLLWVNMHVFFSVGIMMVFGVLLEKILQKPKIAIIRSDPAIKILALILFLLVAVSMVNPRGIEGVLYRYPSNFPITISENQPLKIYQANLAPWGDVSVALFWPLAILVIMSFIFGFMRGRRPYFNLFAGLATIILSIFILRGIAFFGLMLLPILASNFLYVFERMQTFILQKSRRLWMILAKAIPVALVVVLALLVYPGNSKLKAENPGIGLTNRSEDAIRFFQEEHIKGPILNDADSGSYLIYYLYPDERVFSDNRFADAYSPGFFNYFLSFMADENTWQKALKEYHFNAIFFYQYDEGPNVRSFLIKRINDPEWALVYGDTFNIILVRNNKDNEELIKKFGINAQNVQDRLSSLANSDNPDDMISAADIMNMVGRNDLGTETFFKVVMKWPDRPKIWMILGEWELAGNGGNDKLALMYFNKAIDLGQQTAEAYSFLGASYIRLGYLEKAREALLHALRINPERQDAKNLLQQIGYGK